MKQQLLEIDRHGALKPPPSFWLCAAFLSRYWLLLLMIASSWLGPADNIAWAYELLWWPMLAVESPVLVLIVVMLLRGPKAGSLVRMLWHRGRELLALSAVASLAWALWYLAPHDVWNPVPERLVAALALIDLAIAAAIWRSMLYRDLFADFPFVPTPYRHER